MDDSTPNHSDNSPASAMVSRASAAFIVLALLLAMAVQIALYWPTTKQLPFGDDWGVPLSEINRGNLLGIRSFFTETRQPDSYRPMQSLLMWFFGRVEEPQRWLSIRVLHFICSAALLGSLGLMLRVWRVGRAGVLAAMLLTALHPTLVAPVGSIDGFSSLLACAFVWIGVWAMYATRRRPGVGVVAACFALILGTLVKEYAFALAPMAVLTAFCFYRPKWRWTIITAIALGILTFALLWMRQYVKPTDLELPPSDFVLDSPKALLLNVGLVIAGGLFFGDSFGLYLDRSPFMLLVSGLIAALTGLLLVGGWWRRMRERADVGVVPPRWILAFLVLSFAAVTFPANAVMKISEMYLCGLVVTVGLLIGFAVDGWSARRDSNAIACWLIVLALAVTAGFADRHKIKGMLQMGELAKVQADQLAKIVSGEPEARRVKILYRKDQLQKLPTFSSYRLADCYLIRPTVGWVLFPGRDLTIDCVPPLADAAAVNGADRSDAEIVLFWDVAAQRYVRLK